jgi:hypothetical protein
MAKTKDIPKNGKAKHFRSMNHAIHLEHRASSSRGKHEGESSLGLCDRLDRTRDNSQRQLPTDHDYAVPTREYQTDQSSPFLPRLLLALSSGRPRQLPKQPHYRAELTRSLHIRPEGTDVRTQTEIRVADFPGARFHAQTMLVLPRGTAFFIFLR